MVKFTETQQWMSGQEVENWLDDYFTQVGYRIERTTVHEERVLCIGDRHYYLKETHFTVEYKSGIQTHFTGNVFLETISVDTQNKPGWVYTCNASMIFYALLLDGKILVFHPYKLRKEIDYLKSIFREVPTGKGQNKGYNTHGVLVPVEYAEKHLTRLVIPTDDWRNFYRP